MDYKSTAIVLRSSRLSESDKILHLYSPEYGPLRAIAKGAYKLNSKLASKSQVLSICEYQIAKGRNLDIIKEAKLLESFRGINSNYEALTMACFWVDIVDHVAVSDDHYMEPYGLLVAALVELNQSANNGLTELTNLSVKFIWDLIEGLGYKPELDICSLSGKRRSQEQIPQYYDFDNGSITSSNAFASLLELNPYIDHVEALQPVVFKVLESLDKRTWFDLSHDFDSLRSCLVFLKRHLAYCLHKEFKSWSLVQEILQSTPQLKAA